MSRYIISSVFFVFCIFRVTAQDNGKNEKDSIVYQQKYGLRVGIDLGKPVRSFFGDNYNGLELTGDFRLSQNLYVAAELGTEKKTSKETLYTFTTSGSYLRAGVDYNLYENWYGMENLIFTGGRLGVATFSQDLEEYRIYTTDPYWGENLETGTDENILGESSGLTAQWLEVLFGTKVELFNNLYLGGTVRLTYLLNDTPPDAYTNMWIPGFQKVTDDSRFGLTFNYTISYLIPIFKKDKSSSKKKTESKED